MNSLTKIACIIGMAWTIKADPYSNYQDQNNIPYNTQQYQYSPNVVQQPQYSPYAVQQPQYSSNIVQQPQYDNGYYTNNANGGYGNNNGVPHRGLLDKIAHKVREMADRYIIKEEGGSAGGVNGILSELLGNDSPRRNQYQYGGYGYNNGGGLSNAGNMIR